ncbi:MAG: hypothetical protein AAFY26_17680, partial [Cyanobacteria bacterium J06638_22]
HSFIDRIAQARPTSPITLSLTLITYVAAGASDSWALRLFNRTRYTHRKRWKTMFERHALHGVQTLLA